MRRPRTLALLLASLLALTASAAGQARLVTAMRSITSSELAAACAGMRCTTRWSGRSPSRALRVRVVSRASRTSPDASLWLELTRGTEHWEQLLGESGEFCGGDREGSRMTSWIASRLVDFHGGPEPEIFVDVHQSVYGGETSVSQFGTTVCSLEAVTPSCHTYVGGTSSVAPRTFPTRGHIAIGSIDFEVPFLP